MKRLDYDGTPKFERPRKLEDLITENTSVPENLTDAKPPVKTEREETVDNIFFRLASTYIKGNVVKKGLGAMEPAQYIPIDEGANAVIAAATRLFKSESNDGSIITYSMYQKCVDSLYEKKWELRKDYIFPDLPPSKESVSYSETKKNKSRSKIDNLIKDFLDHNGIAGSLLAMLALSPFQAVVFQTLGVENAAKGVQAAQIPIGIALFIELGMKADAILELFKKAKINLPVVEQAIDQMKDPVNRSKAFSDYGIDYDNFKRSVEDSDQKVIIQYVSDYYQRYGGLVAPGSHITIDHWIAYLNVSNQQHTIRGALNTGDSYSREFSNLVRPEYEGLENQRNLFDSNKSQSPVSVKFLSNINSLQSSSDRMYDDIVNSFMYQITDDQLCCLVSIFGSFADTDFIRTMAALLRLLSADLSSMLALNNQLLLQHLSNMFISCIFELIADMDKLQAKVLSKLTKAFTVDIDGLERCVGMLSIGYALIQSVSLLFNQIRDMIRELSSIIHSYGTAHGMTWSVAADRRYLFTMARLLELMAARLDVASVCDNKLRSPENNTFTDSELKDIIAGEVVHKILDKSPPSIGLTNQEIDRYFPNMQPTTSERFKFNFGIADLQKYKNSEQKNCNEQLSKEEVDALFQKFNEAITKEFT